MTATTPRDTTINLRAKRGQRELIDRAASVQQKTRSEFMLEAACEKAEQVLLDQTLFVLDSRRFAELTRILDAPVKPNARVLKLLATRAPWER